jgi:hypothetical protein
VGRARPRGFDFGGIVAGLVCAAGLNLVSPDALIARTNVARAADGASFDAVHAGRLSADAVPVLLRGLPRLPEPERCTLAGELVRRWSPERPGGWRSWNYGDWRARRLMLSEPPAACERIPTSGVQ